MKTILREFEHSVYEFFNNNSFQCGLRHCDQRKSDFADYFVFFLTDRKCKNHRLVLATNGQVNDLVLDLIGQSKNWGLKIKNMESKNSQIMIYLDRVVAFYQGINSALMLDNEYGSSSIFCGKSVLITNDLVCHFPSSLTELRLQLCTKLLARVLVSGGAIIALGDNEEVQKHLHLGRSSRNDLTTTKDNFCFIFVNVVQNSDSIELSEYIKKRIQSLKSKNDKINTHLTDEDWNSLVDAILLFELLKTNVRKSVVLPTDVDKEQGMMFAMYNYIRLKTILDIFEEKVTAGVYPKLPELRDLDFSCLTQTDEWRLLLNFVLYWPNVLMDVIQLDSEDIIHCKLHTIICFLHSLTKCVSSFYGQIKVLTGSRPQLLPYLFCRIYLLKAVTTVMLNCFTILGIKPLSRM